jgi:hypothetical protein
MTGNLRLSVERQRSWLAPMIAFHAAAAFTISA